MSRIRAKTIAGLALAAAFCAPLAPAGLIRFAPDAAIPVSQLPLQQVPKRPEVCKVGAADMPWFTERLERETDPRWVEYAERCIDRAIEYQRMALRCWIKEYTLIREFIPEDGIVPKHPQLLSWHGESIDDWAWYERNRQDAGKWAWMMRRGLADESSVDCCLRYDKDADYHFGVETGALAGLVMVAGFYDATQSGSGQTWYVSVTDGSDSNTGASSTPGATGPFLTWAHAEAQRRTGHDDWILLDARDTFPDWIDYGFAAHKAGVSATERQLLGSYGIGSGARATITPSDTSKIPWQVAGASSSYWLVQNLFFDSGMGEGDGDPAEGWEIGTGAAYITLDCVRAQHFKTCNAAGVTALEYNRCVVHDNFADSGISVGGIYMAGCVGVIRRECVLDRNGIDGYGANIFTHNDYCHSTNSGAQTIRMISGRASSKAIGCRAGGITHNCFATDSPVLIETGGVDRVVTGESSYNVITGENVTVGGTYAYIINLTEDYSFHHNMMVKCHTSPPWLIVTGSLSSAPSGYPIYGIPQTNLDIHDCVAVDCYNSYDAYQGKTRIDSGQDNTTITNLTVYQPTSGACVSCLGSGGTNDGANECLWTDCTLYSANGAGNLVDFSISSAGFESYVAAGGGSVTGGIYTAPTFTDSAYDIEAYGDDNSVVGLTIDDFMDAAVLNRRNAWDPIYTARLVNDAFRAAFDLPEIGTVDPPTGIDFPDGPTQSVGSLTPNPSADSHRVYLGPAGGPYTLFREISGAPTSITLEPN